MTNNNTKGPGALRIAMPRRRRHTEDGQSLIAAIIVLFLLLVLGAAFVALVANNLRNARQSARRNAADFYSEAGIRYMDEQLTKSAEGADWRPVPPDPNISPQDPDYTWLRPYDNNNTPNNLADNTNNQPNADINDDIGGYTRINFGGDTPGSPGGRALVRVTYSPEPINPNPNTNASPDAAARKLIRLEAIGRVGIITSGDPTTYNNSQAASLRRELVAYKEIGITDYLRYFTNKDNKPTTATLGSANQVFDAPATAGNPGGQRTALASEIRDVESYYIGGGIRSNAPLTFYGVNRMVMNPLRGEGLQVAGLISLANIPGTATQAYFDTLAASATPKAGNPARVTLQTAINGAAVNVFPSTSSAFNTYTGVVRDNPAGSDTQGLRTTTGDPANTNLRSVPRAGAPLLNAESASGVNRYVALTRDAAPLPVADTGTAGAVAPVNAGANGWGTNLYIANRNDIQRNFSRLTNTYSLRTDWLNPGGGRDAGFWKKDFVYVPPGVTITLTPRYIVLTRSGDQLNPVNTFIDRYRFRRPDGTLLRTEQSVIRYTYDANDAAMTNPPSVNVGENVAPGSKFAGYPARKNDDEIGGSGDEDYYTSNYVIYAEGNVRIRGVAGGYDPETAKYFLRHLTVVSGGTIYVDGNLLRDNIPSTDSSTAGAAVRGQSSIALLAQDYVAINTSQFLASRTGTNIFSQNSEENYAFSLNSNPNQQTYDFTMDRGPVDANNTPPSALTNYPLPTIFFRHGTSAVGGTAGASPTEGNATIVMGVNGSLLPAPGNPFNFNGNRFLRLNEQTSTSPTFVDQAFSFQTPAPQSISFLYGPGGQTGPFPAVSAPYLELGGLNQLSLVYDPSASGQSNSQPYFATRVAMAPLDVRIEAVMYAQEGSFFIIPGPWLNPNPEDTYESYIASQLRPDDATLHDLPAAKDTVNDPYYFRNGRRVDPNYPFYRQPQDIRMTFFGAITENLPAEIGDQSAWLEKWGWVPRYQGSTGLPFAGLTATSSDPNVAPVQPTDANGVTVATIHGPLSQVTDTANVAGGFILRGQGRFFTGADTGNGIVYEYDTRASAPYRANGAPIRPNPYRLGEPLPIAPHLPVAPGLLYVGERPVQPLP